MEMLTKLLFKKRSSNKQKNNTLIEIRKNLEEYSCNHISIKECVVKTAHLTAELIFLYISEIKEKKSVYDSIIILTSNYYAMLHIDMYTGFYTVNRKYTCDMVSSLVDEVLKESAKKQGGLKSTDLDSAIRLSRDYTQQIVEVYYRAGIEGCQRYITSAIYSTLLSEYNNLSVNRDRIEYVVRTIQAEKVLAHNDEYAVFSLENTG